MPSAFVSSDGGGQVDMMALVGERRDKRGRKQAVDGQMVSLCDLVALRQIDRKGDSSLRQSCTNDNVAMSVHHRSTGGTNE